MAGRDWETLLDRAPFALRRCGRFLVADLKGPHRVLSTSVCHGGQAEHIRHILNHQSCEGAGHHERHQLMTRGLEAYHDVVCHEAALPAEETVVMGTAANMNYVAIISETDESVSVTAAVTAGVQGNATTAGDPASWRETPTGMLKVAAYQGTINTMLFVDRPVTSGALARLAVTMTEAKSAALQRLAVPSTVSVDLATGTGTDQYCIAVPMEGGPPLTSASPHVKFGELAGLAVRKATAEALRWQNGLEPSYTRSLFHALGRYGVRESTVFDDLVPLLDRSELELLRRNAKAAFHEPLVAAAAYALAAVCDRVRYGTIPSGVASDAMTQQAAALAANLAAQAHRWPEFRAALHPHAAGDVKALVLRAVALGWSRKWQAI